MDRLVLAATATGGCGCGCGCGCGGCGCGYAAAATASRQALPDAARKQAAGGGGSVLHCQRGSQLSRPPASIPSHHVHRVTLFDELPITWGARPW
jgi:hypothetical protein